MMASIDPVLAHRRSQLYRWHQQHNAVFVAHGDSVMVGNYGELDDEKSAAACLGLCDLSLLPRQGIIGAGSTAWLPAHDYAMPQQPNTSVTQDNGDLLVRLSAAEFLCLRLSCLGGAAPSHEPDWPGESDSDDLTYPAPRSDSHCLFSITGDRAAVMFSKICGVDLRPHMFDDGAAAQTSVARVNAIVIRHDLRLTNNYYLLAATSVAEYLWECLLDAFDEFDGKPIGVTALHAISRTSA